MRSTKQIKDFWRLLKSFGYFSLFEMAAYFRKIFQSLQEFAPIRAQI